MMSKLTLLTLVTLFSHPFILGRTQCPGLIAENNVPTAAVNPLRLEPSHTQANAVDTSSDHLFAEREELYIPPLETITEYPDSDKAKMMLENRAENLKKIKFLMEIGKLKQIERTGWVLNKISSPERISGHMYRMAIIPLLVLSSSTQVNMDKVIKMALVHDIAECIVGDFTPYDTISPEEKHRLEEDAVLYLSSLLPDSISGNFLELYRDYENQATPEAKLTKELDRFEMVVQAFEYEKSEFKKHGRLPRLGEFFDFDKILSYIRNPELKAMLTELLHQRAEFLANACVHTCTEDGGLSKNKRFKKDKKNKFNKNIGDDL